MKLKPRCVSINDLAVRAPDKKASAKDLVKVTEDLSLLLDRQVAQDPSVLDEKIADYVFFPLSNILRNQHQYPIRLTELTIKCLRILTQYGWKSKIPMDLAQQLLILLAFIIGGVPGQERKEPIPEETELEAFKALTTLVKASGSSSAGAAALVETNAIPTLGHAITVVLDGITDGKTPDIQLESLETLDALYTAVRDQTALATFLPGMVSSLGKLLTPPSALKTQRRVLIRGIIALQDVLTRVLGDIKIMGIMKRPTGDKTENDAEGKVLTSSWLKATAAKVKLALASVLKLRSHGSEDVQSALEKLCITLLDECHQSLADCASILTETAMILSNTEEDRPVHQTSLTDLARIYPELGDTIKTTIYNWVTSLPRIVQSSDERIKQQAIRNLLKGQKFITTLQLDSSILDDSLAASLRDSTTALILSTKPGGILSDNTRNAIELNDTRLTTSHGTGVFQPILIAQETERSTRSALLDFLSKIGPVSQQVKLASDMLHYVRESSGPTQVASYWLAFELIKSTWTQSSELDEFLDLSSVANTSDDTESVFQELYSFSVAVLDSQAEVEEIDWRMQALALEVITFAASRMQESFRPELIDVLYPIATFLGSDVLQLREHAIVSLNSISASCVYSNVTELIIDNVDYMVNSVSLRLNTFDISPASTQVLRMMIRLTGPKLIPYLDDVVASIFAALDNYHGYTLFVESLFNVLTEVVQQGTKSDNLLLEDVESSRRDHKKRTPSLSSMTEIYDLLNSRLERQRKLQQKAFVYKEMEQHPQRPWKSTETTGLPREEENDDDEPSTEVEKPPPPKTPTFQLLSRITNLTQHYLTSPTPTLRKSLLDLLTIVCPALSPDEDAFLPLVNSVWPVLVERLYDPETFVVISACKALSALCQSAGDFLNTRIKTEWWDNLSKWCRKAKSDAARSRGNPKISSSSGGRAHGKTEERGILIPTRSYDSLEGKDAGRAVEIASHADTGLGKFAQAAQVWEAVQELLVTIVSYVQVDDDIFDEISLLLADTLASNPDVRAALEMVDADAVWLLMYQRGMAPAPAARPVMPGVAFVEI
ncbi:HEAT repeat protein [Biscogniauxia marginata]|nr:HEAT repeat protein [Biscogniauxia marginata]